MESNRIYGGNELTPDGDNYIPWQVSIRRPKRVFLGAPVWGTSYTHTCGGVIIGEDIILSAAHCFVDDFTMEDVKKGATKPRRPLNDNAYQFVVGAVGSSNSEVSKYI